MTFIKSKYVACIRANLFKSVEATFYETLRKFVNIVMYDEHPPLQSLLNMLFVFHVEH